MTELSELQVSFISEEIKTRGIELDELHDDLLDHICTSVERKMDQGENFDSAFVQTVKLFGPNGLLKIQHQTLLLITQMNETMKKLSIGFGLATTAFLLVGIFFKIMHWPGAGIMLVLGNALLVTGYLPILLTHKLRESPKNERLSVVIGFAGLAIFTVGVTFKIMHWPYATILFWTGFLSLVVIYIPLYFFHRFKVSKNKTVTATSAMIAFIVIALMLELMNMRSSSQYNHGITAINHHIEQHLGPLDYDASPKFEVLNEFEDFNLYIEDLKTRIKSGTSGLSSELAQTAMLSEINNKHDFKYPRQVLYGEGEIEILKQKAASLQESFGAFYPAAQSERPILDFKLNETYRDVNGAEMTWSDFYFRDVPLIGVISNLSFMQLQAKHASDVALIAIKNQSEVH